MMWVRSGLRMCFRPQHWFHWICHVWVHSLRIYHVYAQSDKVTASFACITSIKSFHAIFLFIDNSVGDDGIDELVQALHGNITLKHLNLACLYSNQCELILIPITSSHSDNDGIGESGIMHLCEALPHSAIDHINLAGEIVHDITVMMQFLTNGSLMTGCELTEKCRYLLAKLIVSKPLGYLTLDRCWLRTYVLNSFIIIIFQRRRSQWTAWVRCIITWRKLMPVTFNRLGPRRVW